MVNQVADLFTALGDPTRRQVVDLLCRTTLPAGELARECGMSGPAMSRHLRVLRRSGLVEVVQSQPESDARVRAYRLRPEPFHSLKEWVDHLEEFWNTELAAFKAYAEQKHLQPRKIMKGRKK
jgi:DNA-binding transcriptional ArsR family regulator